MITLDSLDSNSAGALLRGIISMGEDNLRKLGCTLRPVFFLLVVLLTTALGIDSMVVTLKVVENFLPSSLSEKIEIFMKSTLISINTMLPPTPNSNLKDFPDSGNSARL